MRGRGGAIAAMLLLVLAYTGAAQAKGGRGWTVKPEWVRADEEALASDAMRGRGSATHDEEVAAEYIVGRFEGFGLTPAPGMSGYLQTAEVISPELQGQATLTAETGRVDLTEGADFTLLSSSGASVHGRLQRVKLGEAATAKVAQGTVVLLTGVPDALAVREALRSAQDGGAAGVLLAQSEFTQAMFLGDGGRTALPVGLKDGPAERPRMTVVALDPAALAEVEGVHDGQQVTLTVHAVAKPQPRATYNAIGFLRGTDPGAGTILLSAHLDHLGVGAPVDGDAIWNGANDDAAGITAVLELAHALTAGPPLRRSVLFVCYGSEEIGELGSTYFGEHPPVPIKSLVANLEFEMIGDQDPKMPKGVLMFTGWGRSNLGPELKAHGALVGPDPYPEQHFFERSDNYSLALKGVVAHTMSGQAMPPTYHRPNDDIAHLNIPYMAGAIESLVGPVRWLAGSGFVPQWNAGGRPTER